MERKAEKDLFFYFIHCRIVCESDRDLITNSKNTKHMMGLMLLSC